MYNGNGVIRISDGTKMCHWLYHMLRWLCVRECYIVTFYVHVSGNKPNAIQKFVLGKVLI